MADLVSTFVDYEVVANIIIVWLEEPRGLHFAQLEHIPSYIPIYIEIEQRRLAKVVFTDADLPTLVNCQEGHTTFSSLC